MKAIQIHENPPHGTSLYVIGNSDHTHKNSIPLRMPIAVLRGDGINVTSSAAIVRKRRTTQESVFAVALGLSMVKMCSLFGKKGPIPSFTMTLRLQAW